MDLDLEQMFDVFEAADSASGEPSTPATTFPTTSAALPGQPRPVGLNSFAIAGDAGFDPLGFSKDKESLLKYRSAEIKHARLAMLAAAGWPLGEVFDRPLANALNLISPAYWVTIIGLAAAVEALGFTLKNADEPGN